MKQRTDYTTTSDNIREILKDNLAQLKYNCIDGIESLLQISR